MVSPRDSFLFKESLLIKLIVLLLQWMGFLRCQQSLLPIVPVQCAWLVFNDVNLFRDLAFLSPDFTQDSQARLFFCSSLNSPCKPGKKQLAMAVS